MSEKIRTKVSFDEDVDVMDRIDAIAELEGTSRTAIIRRALRRLLLSLPTIPTSELQSEQNNSVAA